MENKMTKKEFYKEGLDKATKSNIRWGGIIFYVAAASTLLVGALNNAVGEMIIDVVLCLIVGLAIHIGKSRIASLIGAAYGIFSVVYSLATTGQLMGWLIPIAGICATIGTFKAAKAWKEYKKSGELDTADFAPESFTVPEQVNAIEEGSSNESTEG